MLNDDELTLYYSDADRSLIRVALSVCAGLVAVLFLGLLFVGGRAVGALASLILPLCFLVGLFFLHAWRNVSGQWWLRLTPVGFEVNDRACCPRRYLWSDIDEFLVVLEPVEVKPRVEPDAQTVAAVLSGRDASHNALVGFRFLPGKRPSPRRKADGYVMVAGIGPLTRRLS